MNGEKLKNQLGVNMDPHILNECLYHASYSNEIRIEKHQIEIQKAYTHTGKLIYHLVLASLIAKEETINHKEINEKLAQYKDEILIQFYDKNNLNDFMYIGKGELTYKKERYLEHCLILFYHIYKQVGFKGLEEIIYPFYKVSKNVDIQIDYKSALQEHVQKQKITSESIIYEMLKEEGPPHDRQFTVKVSVNGYEGLGVANSKKKAQQIAAQNWFENSKAMIFSKERKQPVQKAKGNLRITKSREIELMQVYKNLNLSKDDICLVELDICLTHKSFANEKRLSTMEKPSYFAWVGAIVIPFMLGEYILKDFVNMANGMYSRLMELTGSLVSKKHLSTCLPDSTYKSIKISTTNDLNSLAIRADIVQTLVGAMFIKNLEQNNEGLFENIKPFIHTFIIASFDNNSSAVDYRSYLQILIQELRIETKAKKLISSGPAHQSKHEVIVSTFFANGGKYLEGTGKASTKKESINIACKKIIEKMINLYNLNNKELELPNKLIFNHTLDRFVYSALNNKNPQKFLEVIGGLCTQRWSLAHAVNIANHLYSRGLISRLIMLLIKWEYLYSKEIVEECINQFPSEAKEVVLKKWNETSKKRDEFNKDNHLLDEEELEGDFFKLLEDLEFKPTKNQNKIIGKIGIIDQQVEDENEAYDEYEEYDDISDLLDFEPIPK
ncbi:putative dsRNA-binding protein [Sutcliffiella deserti]|uniref:putative dsRNA-binding protein n=1 Tax=Sutcliffiella deserti TaxID=2875501 RepID=UPI001CC073A1|nr:putative dsRNA-binding protein [Sutcliffiella deserti]